ncbi:hypothetical protein ACQKFG_26800 [Peribacillus sp. NPDC076916]|uniref:hypothetical protein n=1 Tax=Peribacillus sp. NPDC076916 TaxID=3390608 RepID=UPI003D07FE40
MNINIKVYLHSKETKFSQKGSFPVPNAKYKEDPDWTAAVAAYEWIQKIKSSYAASKDFRIDHVVYTMLKILRS